MFRYTVEQAILDGFLVDYEPIAIKSEVRMNGVFLKEGETVERVDTDTGQKALDQLEDERAYDAASVERDITAPDSNQAHRATGFKALADVISMVKHAAATQSPLLTAEERVNRAMDEFLSGHKLTAEQTQWLSLVSEHLVKNLSMDEEDFDLTPLLEMRGGKAKARKVSGDLPQLVAALNEALAV